MMGRAWMVGLLLAIGCDGANVEVVRNGDRCLVVYEPAGCSSVERAKDTYWTDCPERTGKK